MQYYSLCSSYLKATWKCWWEDGFLYEVTHSQLTWAYLLGEMSQKLYEKWPMPMEGKMAQPLERQQWSTVVERLQFCLGFTVKWRLALTISYNFPAVAASPGDNLSLLYLAAWARVTTKAKGSATGESDLKSKVTLMNLVIQSDDKALVDDPFLL